MLLQLYFNKSILKSNIPIQYKTKIARTVIFIIMNKFKKVYQILHKKFIGEFHITQQPKICLQQQN